VNHVPIPQQVGADEWPVISAVRIGDSDRPAVFAAVVDCREPLPERQYATVEIVVWPPDAIGTQPRPTCSHGHYNLTLAEAAHDMLERARLLPQRLVEAVVELREPYEPNRTTVYVDGRPADDHNPDVRAAVAVVYTDPDDQPESAASYPPAGLSPAAADHVLALYARIEELRAGEYA